jgi:hypothetical protein
MSQWPNKPSAAADAPECLISPCYRPVIGVDRYLYVIAVASVTSCQRRTQGARVPTAPGSAGRPVRGAGATD